jgi:phenylalanyl-tRNA synthetase alpha chain
MIIDELERKNKITHETRDNQDLDFFLEGKKFCSGSIHPITQIKMEIYEIFYTLGYEIIESSEIETSENNFDYLNIPQGHPARDANDTFYLKGKNDLLLRTHTSNTQVRMMKKRPNQEMKVVSSGKVYRRDEDDTTHTHQFTQVEGF